MYFAEFVSLFSCRVFGCVVFGAFSVTRALALASGAASAGKAAARVFELIDAQPSTKSHEVYSPKDNLVSQQKTQYRVVSSKRRGVHF